MKLLDADDAIECIEEQMADFKEIMEIYVKLLTKLKEIDQGAGAKAKLIEAGFTLEQIETFIEVLMSE